MPIAVLRNFVRHLDLFAAIGHSMDVSYRLRWPLRDEYLVLCLPHLLSCGMKLPLNLRRVERWRLLFDFLNIIDVYRGLFVVIFACHLQLARILNLPLGQIRLLNALVLRYPHVVVVCLLLRELDVPYPQIMVLASPLQVYRLPGKLEAILTDWLFHRNILTNSARGVMMIQQAVRVFYLLLRFVDLGLFKLRQQTLIRIRSESHGL